MRDAYHFFVVVVVKENKGTDRAEVSFVVTVSTATRIQTKSVILCLIC